MESASKIALKDTRSPLDDFSRCENVSFLRESAVSPSHSPPCLKSQSLQRFLHGLLLIYSVSVYITAAFARDYRLSPAVLSLEFAALLVFLSKHCVLVAVFGISYARRVAVLCECAVVIGSLGLTAAIMAGFGEVWLWYGKATGLLLLFSDFRHAKKDRKLKVKPATIVVTTAAQDIVTILSSIRRSLPTAELQQKLNWCIAVISEGKLHQANRTPEPVLSAKEALPWIHDFNSDQSRRKSDELLAIPLFPDMSLTSDSVFYLPEAVHSCLLSVQQLSFDIFALGSATEGNELLTLVTFLFSRSQLLGFFPGTQLREWTLAVQLGYRRENPYHNATHAADVLQTVHCLLFEYKAVEILELHLLDVACCYIAAAIHDFQHPGRSNKFLIATHHPLSILYNDSSVLESHHVASAFALSEKENRRIFERLKANEYTYLRALVIEMVLATDMSRHFVDLTAFQLQGDRQDQCDSRDKSLALSMLLHTCDISNPAKSWQLCRKWALLISEEFFAQGEEERAAGLPVSDLCDREKTVVEKAQIGFIGVIVQPLLEAMEMRLPGLREATENLRKNKEKWRELLETRESGTEEINGS